MAARTDVRVAQTVLDDLDQRLAQAHAAAVARRIDQLADQPGVPLVVADTAAAGVKRYLVAIPDEDHAPVVIYRHMADEEQGDIFVAALIDRIMFTEYLSAARQGILDHPVVRRLSSLLAAHVSGADRLCPPVGT